jgi:hypothetical protein
MEKFDEITQAKIASLGVQSLADRPNASSQYGVGGLTAFQLKGAFDQLAIFLAQRINLIQSVLASEKACEYILIKREDGKEITLSDFFVSILDGELANFFKLHPNLTSNDLMSIQEIINSKAIEIANLASDIRTVKSDLETVEGDYINSKALEGKLTNLKSEVGCKLRSYYNENSGEITLYLDNDRDYSLSAVVLPKTSSGSGSGTVDKELSLDSENPVQNKVIAARINDIEASINGVAEELQMINEGGIE